VARDFNGSTHHVQLSPGAVDDTGAMTLAAVIKRGSDGSWHAIIYHRRATVNDSTWMEIDSGNNINWAIGDTGLNSSFTVTASENWVLIAVTKAAGTTTPRFHKYVYGTHTWTHSDASGTHASAAGAPDLIRLGVWGASSGSFVDWFDGDMLIAGEWSAALTDAQLENLPYDLSAWISQGPSAVWLLDQAGTQDVYDLTGGGASQSGGTAPAVSTNSQSVWNYGAGVWQVIRPQAAGGGGGGDPAGAVSRMLLGVGR
jgi:hypothetical protein